MAAKKQQENSRLRGPGLVRVLIQERKVTGQFANVVIAAGVQFPITAKESFGPAADAAAVIASDQVKLRIGQVFKKDYKPDKQHQGFKRPGTRVYAGVSRLVPTQEFENVRADVSFEQVMDAEFAANAAHDESVGEAFDRVFEEVGAQIHKAIQQHREGKDELGIRRSGKTRPFDWTN